MEDLKIVQGCLACTLCSVLVAWTAGKGIQDGNGKSCDSQSLCIMAHRWAWAVRQHLIDRRMVASIMKSSLD